MAAASLSAHLWRCHRIVVRQKELKLEDAFCVWRIIRALHCHQEVPQVVRVRRGSDARRCEHRQAERNGQRTVPGRIARQLEHACLAPTLASASP